MKHLNRIQTKNLAITSAPKIASTNLVEFFVDRFDNILEVLEWIPGQIPNTVIVITRNERERWCSGVIQELDNFKWFVRSRIRSKPNLKLVSYILDKEVNSLGQKSMFTNGHAHLGTIGYTSCITELALRDNTHFTDISSLSKKSFWEKVCEMDNTWPHVNEWWDDLSSFRNNIHGPPDLEDIQQNRRRVTVRIVEDMLNNDTRLDFISEILDKTQETINYLKGTDKWIK